MLDEFIRYIEAERRYSPLTVRNYRRDAERFMAWWSATLAQGAPFDPCEVSADDIREWIIHRTEKEHIAARAMNRELSTLRTLYRWLRSTGRVQKDIMQAVPSLRASRRLPAFVPESRMTQIVDECETPADDFAEERNALIILLFYSCGLRLSELIGLDRDDFSAASATLRVRGKGDKERVVPLLAEAVAKIEAHIARIERQNICRTPEKALFLSDSGRRISRSTVYRLVRKELAQADVQGKKSPHVLRHTFATHLMNGGADMREIQELMGHATLQATQVYTHNSIAHLQRVYAKAHPRARDGENEQP